MTDSTQQAKKLRVAATLHDQSGQSPFWATVVLYEDLRAAAVCRGATSRESEELARRFVAASNAVEGVPTEWLEAQFDSDVVILFGKVQPLHTRLQNAMQEAEAAKAERDALKAQRDEMLEALREVFAIGDRLVADVYGGEFANSARALLDKHRPSPAQEEGAAS